MSEESQALMPLVNITNYTTSMLDKVLEKKEQAKEDLHAISETLQSVITSLEGAKEAEELEQKATTLTPAIEHAMGAANAARYAASDSKPKAKIDATHELVREALTVVEAAREAGDGVPKNIHVAIDNALVAAKEAQLAVGVMAKQVQPLNDTLFTEDERAADYVLQCVSTLLFNDMLPVDSDKNKLHCIRTTIQDVVSQIDTKVEQDLNAIIHNPDFRALEANWLGLNDLITNTDWTADVMIDILDVTKEELEEDFQSNRVDLTSSALFKKVYVAEYDQYGGLPYGGMIGLYEFGNTDKDRQWLETMGKVAAASHAPFISAVGPAFFGCENIQELAEIKDIEGHMSHPRYDKWNRFRDSQEAPYIGLTLPRYLLRAPYDPDDNPAGELNFTEAIDVRNGHEDFVWGNAAILFARNMTRSFAESGWCQYLRGPKGGGKLEDLTRCVFQLNGEKEIKIPIEMTIPDYRELQFANAGLIPLIFRKGTSDACFFSCQSIKKPKRFKDPQDSENSQLVTNLAYTFSITRIAHYIKCIMRDNIGSPADAAYINNIIQGWLSQYVTTVMNPDDRTLRYYPFKAAQSVTTDQEGMVGWYTCTVSVLPHLQFEGMDVELQLDVRL